MLSVSAVAQTDRTLTRTFSTVRFVPGSALLLTNPATGAPFQSQGDAFSDTRNDNTYLYNNNVHKPDTTAAPRGELHGSVGLSVMAGLGKGSPRGAGFAQDINLDYTLPLGSRGWLTVGGYMNHLNWSGMNTTSAGIYGALGYQIDDHWSAYVYGQKSLANSGYAYPYYGGFYPIYNGYGYHGYNGYGYPNSYWNADRIGAALRWTPNKNVMLQISVEKEWMPKQDNSYYRRYDYQR